GEIKPPKQSALLAAALNQNSSALNLDGSNKDQLASNKSQALTALRPIVIDGSNVAIRYVSPVQHPSPNAGCICHQYAQKIPQIHVELCHPGFGSTLISGCTGAALF